MFFFIFNKILNIIYFNNCMGNFDKNINNIAYVMKNFYWIQLQFLIFMVFQLMVYIGIFSWMESISLISSTMIIYNRIFSGTTVHNIVLWLMIDVIPYTFVLMELTSIIKEKKLEKFAPLSWEILFAGVFLGFDIVWFGFFWHQYFLNFLIIAVRIIMPYLILMNFQCSDECGHIKKKK